MSTFANTQTQRLKHKLTSGGLIGTAIVTTILTGVHNLLPEPHWLDQLVPPLLAIINFCLFIHLHRKPSSLQNVMYASAGSAVLCLIGGSWLFTIDALRSDEFNLVDRLPPITSVVLLLAMLLAITLPRKYLLNVTIIIWLLIATPIIGYLLLHPQEMTSPRGLDIMLGVGPSMGLQIALLLFYNHLQTIVDRLYTERLQYYSQVIERQSIRQQAIEQAFTQIHNGPLQTLTVLLRDVEQQGLPKQEISRRLDELNGEIRAVRYSLVDRPAPPTNAPNTTNPSVASITPTEIGLSNDTTIPFEFTTSEDRLRLGEGSEIDLNQPLHRLCQTVYTVTLQRHLPHFATVKVKVRNFDPIPTAINDSDAGMSLALKRDLCLWLEEALCNVGKHASGATRIVVTGKVLRSETNDVGMAKRYLLRVQDNGNTQTLNADQQGTQHSHQLAQKLKGNFQRSTLPQGGVVCELSWPIDVSDS